MLGTVNPVKEMIDAAHAIGAYALVDGAQAIQHIPVDVQVLDCDFFAFFQGHKVYGLRELVFCMENVICWSKCHPGRAGRND